MQYFLVVQSNSTSLIKHVQKYVTCPFTNNEVRRMIFNFIDLRFRSMEDPIFDDSDDDLSFNKQVSPNK